MKLLLPIALLIALLVAAVSLDDPAADADIVIINANDAFTLDPQRMSYIHDFRVGYALYEGLVKWNIDDYSIEPAVAETWSVSTDAKTYQFNLSHSARWSNGDPVTAHDFVFSLRRLLLPDTVADYSNLLFVIDGAETFFNWRNEQLAQFAAMQVVDSQSGESHPDAALQLWREMEQYFAENVGVTAIDDYTIVIRLARPTPYFFDLLAFVVCAPVHRPTVEGWPIDDALAMRLNEFGWHGVDAPAFEQCKWVNLNPATGRLEQRHDWARPDTLIGNGSYVLKRWRYKRDMLLVKNPMFHRPAIMRNESVLILTIEDANTRVLTFESGLGDWVTDVGVEYKADMLEQRLRYEHRYADKLNDLYAQGLSVDEALGQLPKPDSGNNERRNIHGIASFGTDFYSFNCREKLADGRDNPFADARVRRAFVQCVNREVIVRDVTRLNEPVMTTLIPPGSIAGYSCPPGLGFDINAARAELQSAGWSDRDGDGLVENESGELFPTVEILWTPSLPRYKWISLELKNQWERGLGVRVELRPVDTKFYREDLRRGNYMIARGRWYGDFGDPTTFLDLNRCGDGNNDRAYCSERFEILMKAAADETNAQKRLQLLSECEQIVMAEDVPLLVLCQLVELYMYEPGKLEGLSHHPRLTQQFWRLHVKRN